MTSADCALIAELCAERVGLRVDPEATYVIDSRLGPLARREGFASVSELAHTLAARTDERLITAAVEAMAPAETAFFRDRATLERLWSETIPEIARRKADGVVRVWSAGCASGQEIYSLAMLQAEQRAPTGQVELYASDYAERLMDRARAGTYSSFEVQRGLSARELVRHFENRGDQFQLNRALRQAVRWRCVNLLDDLSALGRFDIVLCRNVLSSLTPAARARVLKRLDGVLADDGLLVLGSGEEAEGLAAFAPAAGMASGFVRAGRVQQAA